MSGWLVLNPATNVNVLDSVLEDIDLVLIMSVNPGFGGQSFIHSSLEKIAAVRGLIDQSGRSIRLEVDGGINKDTIAAAIKLVLILLWQVRQFLIVKIMQRPFPNFVKRLLSSLSIFWLLTPIFAS